MTSVALEQGLLRGANNFSNNKVCLLYTSDAADD